MRETYAMARTRGRAYSFPPVVAADIALVSLGTTPGLRRADDAFVQIAREAGARCELARVRIGAAGRLRRHPAATDLIEALAARRAARGIPAGTLVYSTVTAALLRPDRGEYAVRFDSTAALNRPGLAGRWQRERERRVLRDAGVLLPWGDVAASAIPPGSAPAVVLRVPIDPVARPGEPDVDAIAYAGWPRKRGLELLCQAWANAAPHGARLQIGGLDREKGVAWLDRCGVPEPAGVEWLGVLPRELWLQRVARARTFVNASRQEDHGLAQLEALSAGTPLVTVPSPGAYEALPLARVLDPALVAGEVRAEALARALAAGLALGDADRVSYAQRAGRLLEPFRPEAVRDVMAREVLPTLGVGG
jgi:glycosyltransferase involved in cell wall biosynthesis